MVGTCWVGHPQLYEGDELQYHPEAVEVVLCGNDLMEAHPRQQDHTLSHSQMLDSQPTGTAVIQVIREYRHPPVEHKKAPANAHEVAARFSMVTDYRIIDQTHSSSVEATSVGRKGCDGSCFPCSLLQGESLLPRQYSSDRNILQTVTIPDVCKIVVVPNPSHRVGVELFIRIHMSACERAVSAAPLRELLMHLGGAGAGDPESAAVEAEFEGRTPEGRAKAVLGAWDGHG